MIYGWATLRSGLNLHANSAHEDGGSGDIVTARTKQTHGAEKFRDPRVTASGEVCASAGLDALRTLWFNTGTLCNIACTHCYIESSPTNDRLVYLSRDDVGPFLDEVDPSVDIGFTGGEPFMNPHIIDLLGMALALGHHVQVQTNAMRPMMRLRTLEGLLHLRREHGERLVFRVSLDHPDAEVHDAERGAGAFDETIAGIDWLMANGFVVHVAGRQWGGDEAVLRRRYGALFTDLGWPIDEKRPPELVLLPELDVSADAPEITATDWDRLGVRPQDMMCASSRMILKRAGQSRPVVTACVLLPYDPRFELGATLAESVQDVALNHPCCAQVCVRGGGACAT